MCRRQPSAAVTAPSSAHPLRLRHKLAAFGVVGVALCLWPLWQLWNWHDLELQWAVQEARTAEPGLLAVQTQRALLQHQLASARVLHREQAAEPLRREHQAEVEARLLQLERALEPGGLLPARIEVQAMRLDWPPLVDRIVQARCSVPESDDAHRLLQEQALQVIDIVTAALEVPRDAQLAQAQQLLLQTLPRQLAVNLPGAAGAVDPAVVAQSQGAEAWLAATAQAQRAWQQAGSQRQARHARQRLLASGGLLAAGAIVLGGAVWLLRSLRRPLVPVPPSPGDLPKGPSPACAGNSRPADSGPLQASDGQQSQRLEGQRLMQRLRGPGAHPRRHPPLDAPTQPQEP
jgi:hypothetical protein